MHLSPVFIRYALQQEDPARLRRLHPEDCITCGCCSYICPANIPLVQLVARAKAQLEQKEAQS
jgi:electron transport complex protein RnfC